MAHMVTALSAGKFFGQTGIEDDLVDRLHYIFTSGILVVFAVGVSWKQFGGKPIECSIPEQVPGVGSEEFVEMYCFSKDTYFVPWEEDIPPGQSERKSEEISYYQWVPFFLLAEALMFRLPCMFWKLVASHSGIKVHHLVQQATNERNIDVNLRKQTIQMLTIHIDNALRYHRRVGKRKLIPHTCLLLMNLPYSSAYVALMYLCTKIFYLFTVVGSFVWLNKFMLRTDSYDFYGFGAFTDLINGTHWDHSGLFPRVTICDFPVRTLGQIQHFSIQCALIINLLNEKIFVFLWCWYVVLSALTILSTIYWATVTMLPTFRRWFVVRHLELADMPFDAKESADEVERFVFRYLHVDGAFILRVVTAHAGVVMGTDLTMSLWKHFYGIPQSSKSGEPFSKPKAAAGAPSAPDGANETHVGIEQPDTANSVDKYGEYIVPDFTKSPIYKEEMAYERGVSEIRRRGSNSTGRISEAAVEHNCKDVRLGDNPAAVTSTSVVTDHHYYLNPHFQAPSSAQRSGGLFTHHEHNQHNKQAMPMQMRLNKCHRK